MDGHSGGRHFVLDDRRPRVSKHFLQTRQEQQLPREQLAKLRRMPVPEVATPRLQPWHLPLARPWPNA
eukprot:9212289-Alexandrium_andersonii.AAC.1